MGSNLGQIKLDVIKEVVESNGYMNMSFEMLDEIFKALLVRKTTLSANQTRLLLKYP